MLEKLGQNKIVVLGALYSSLTGRVPSVNKKKFRVDNSENLNTISELETIDQLIKHNSEQTQYTMASYAIPLVDHKSAQQLYTDMASIYKILSELYRTKYDSSISIDELLVICKLSKNRAITALYQLSQCHDVFSGRNNDFPFKSGTTVMLSEKLLTRKRLDDCFDEFYGWNLASQNSPDTNYAISELEYDNKSHNIYFGVSANARPQWYDELSLAEKTLIDEIEMSVKNGARALPIMGIRALIESLMLTYFDDKGSFRKNVNNFASQGHITIQNKQILLSVIDAGSAAIHRAHIPRQEDIATCIAVVVNLLETLKVITPKVKELDASTPKRNQNST